MTNVEYWFMVYGNKFTPFSPTCGFGQGDPLSPYLFILISNVLSRMETNAVEDRTLEAI